MVGVIALVGVIAMVGMIATPARVIARSSVRHWHARHVVGTLARPPVVDAEDDRGMPLGPYWLLTPVY
jgi:hypothetical protein